MVLHCDECAGNDKIITIPHIDEYAGSVKVMIRYGTS
jgi:hypothetical protein